MQKQLLVIFLLLSFSGMAQRGLVFVKKNGIKRVALFAEGAPVSFLIQDYGKMDGTITLVSHDTIFINGLGFPARSVKTIFLPRRNDHLPTQLLYATAGVVLCTAGITAAKWASFKNALAYAAGIAYLPYAIPAIKMLRRKKYRIGKKFTLQPLDLHFTGPAPPKP
jgi:hypothetical protein